MALKKFPYKTLDELIKKNLHIQECFTDKQLILKLAIVRKRGWLEKDELINICYWKSPRSIWLVKKNVPSTIKNVTKSAFKSTDEYVIIQELIKLKGVGIPMASAILMLTNPKYYGVVDIRVWEILFHMKTVDENKKAKNFTISQWISYSKKIRDLSNKFNVTARDIERTLFNVHRMFQEGNLYV